MTEQQFKENLRQFTGTENYYRHILGLTFTDGVKWCSEMAKCYWYIDVVASWQTDKRIRGEEFQVWKLRKSGESTAVVVCEDGNKNELIRQEIPFTDFQFSELVFWCVDRVIMLPSEY